MNLNFMKWINNTDGKPDAMLTMAVIAFVTVIIKFLLSGISFKGFNFGTLDGTLIAALLTPTLGAYVGRRYTDAKCKCDKDEDKPDLSVAGKPTIDDNTTTTVK